MPQSLSKVYTHITFSTKHREPVIDETIQPRLFEHLGGICKGVDCNPVQIGGYFDHVHILCLLSRTISQADLLQVLKKESSKWIKQQDQRYAGFHWQNGYGIFSVNPREVDVVIRYITNQREHPHKKTFENEFRAFLNQYQISFDERYVWD